MSKSVAPVNYKRRRVLTGLLSTGSISMLPSSLYASEVSKKPPSSTGSHRLDLERFVEDCINANKEQDAQAAVNEVLARAVSRPSDVIAALGEPSKAGLNVLLQSSSLTIFAATWTPQMNLMPHDHLMWANIGIYAGREDNIFWKRSDKTIKAYRAEALFVKESSMLPVDALHSVTNPLQKFTGGLHIYGGDFFGTTRSQWDPETLIEEPSTGDIIRSMFHRENQRLGLT